MLRSFFIVPTFCEESKTIFEIIIKLSKRNTCMWGEDSSLKTWVVTHLGTSDANRCLTSEHVSDISQSPSHTRPHYFLMLNSVWLFFVLRTAGFSQKEKFKNKFVTYLLFFSLVTNFFRKILYKLQILIKKNIMK